LVIGEREHEAFGKLDVLTQFKPRAGVGHLAHDALGDDLASRIENAACLEGAAPRADPLVHVLHPMQQQIDEIAGGLPVLAVEHDVIQADPEGQQYGHYPKHEATIATKT